MNQCRECGKAPRCRFYTYCSNKCQFDYQYRRYIESWRDGRIIVRTKNVSGYLKRYLREKYKDRCALCLWSERNVITDKVPLEVDHIDGDADNNEESNLHLLCPNCHSLTAHFRNLNKGRGRKWRLISIRNRLGNHATLAQR